MFSTKAIAVLSFLIAFVNSERYTGVERVRFRTKRSSHCCEQSNGEYPDYGGYDGYGSGLNGFGFGQFPSFSGFQSGYSSSHSLLLSSSSSAWSQSFNAYG
ncbi:hypothetical protein Tcan_11565 [Toxocara canis]|nr:hypothetical protein Tcan_11565 [Toxocara canis]